MKKKKTIILSSLLIVLFLLVGWGSEDVTLFHKNKVIDLQKAIELASSGGDENANDEITVEEEPVVIDSEVIEESEEEPQEITVNIIVSEKTIKIDGKVFSSIDQVKESIKEYNGSMVTFKLIDEYAEARSFKEVISILEELKKEIGVNYTISD